MSPELVQPLMAREAQAFMTLYPEARIDVDPGSSREAIRELFGARSDVAVLTRELAPEERAAAVRGRLELEGYRFAGDAIAMLAHPAMPVENLTLDQVRRIFDGRSNNWQEFGGPAVAVIPVAQAGTSDVTEAFSERVLGGEPVRAVSVIAGSDSEVVDEVARRPGAIGYVSLAWADRGGKMLRISSLAGLPYWKPDLEAIYRNDYPLTRYLNLYVRPNGHPLANGFITFITSQAGQRIVRESGLVPTAVPVRFIRRSPMQGTH